MHGLQTSYTIRTFLILYSLVHFLGFLKQMVDFFFCEGPSDLRIHALTAVRGLTLQIEKIGKYSILAPEIFFFLIPVHLHFLC